MTLTRLFSLCLAALAPLMLAACGAEADPDGASSEPLPIVAPPVGDVPFMVAPENAPFITDYPGEVRLRDAMQALIADPELRRTVGNANRRKAQAEYDERQMIARYAALYESALGRPGALTRA
jgi:glycosyltransferase involved in cell wall biosynthesis